MNLDWIEATWTSSTHGPAPERLEALAGDLLRHLRARARRLRWILAGSGALLLALSVLLGLRLAAGEGQEWFLAPLLIPAWLAFGLALGRSLRHRQAHPASQRSLSELARAAENETRLSRSRVKTIGGLQLLSLPALALGLRGLVDTGRVRPHELHSLIGVLASLVAVSLVGMIIYDRWRLRPRQRQLRALVEAYGSDVS